MMFLTENDFVDVVKEQQFKDVVTVSASSALTLARFRRYSEGKIIVNPENMVFPFMVHVSTSDAAHLIKSSRVYAADKVDNISPEPVAYCYRGFERETENPTWGYCWPSEVDDIYYSLDDLEDVSFYPLFEIPKELQND